MLLDIRIIFKLSTMDIEFGSNTRKEIRLSYIKKEAVFIY